MGALGKLLTSAISGLLLTFATSALPQGWVLTSAPITNWTSVASSADGATLVGVVEGGGIYFSTNAGATWIPSDAPEQSWSGVASSTDGTKLAAVAPTDYYVGGIWASTNSGGHWAVTSAPKTNNWKNVASSADGTQLIGTDSPRGRYPGWIFTSTNSGEFWRITFLIDAGGPESWNSIASSADGAHCMASSGVNIYSSGDHGQTWSQTSATAKFTFAEHWMGLACSAEGGKWVAVSLGGQIQLSVDGGLNWTTSSAPSLSWQATASSADGRMLVAIPTNGPICLSSNSGVSWFATSTPSENWRAAASSADGCKLVAVANGGGIYTWQTSPTPKLNITPSASSLLISWIVPSMPFVLQQNSDLTTPNWTDVITTPILNFTNLHHEVSVPLSSTNRFYRLKRL